MIKRGLLPLVKGLGVIAILVFAFTPVNTSIRILLCLGSFAIALFCFRILGTLPDSPAVPTPSTPAEWKSK
jgi:hypothetical protein